MTLLDSFSSVGFDIYQRPFTSKHGVLVELLNAHFEIVMWAVSFGKEATGKNVLNEVLINNV